MSHQMMQCINCSLQDGTYLQCVGHATAPADSLHDDDTMGHHDDMMGCNDDTMGCNDDTMGRHDDTMGRHDDK